MLIFFTKPGIYLFIAFEMIILLAAANISVGQYNSRDLLYEPVRPYIEQQGFMVMKMGISMNFETGELTHTESADLNELIEDADIVTLKSVNFPECSVTVLPDDVFDRLRLPVEEGSQFSSGSESSCPRLVITQNPEGCKAGDILTLQQQYSEYITPENSELLPRDAAHPMEQIVRLGDDVNFEIAAVLTDPTYIMHLSYSSDMTFDNLYMNYDREFYKDQYFCYTCESELNKADIVKDLISEEMSSIIRFREPLSDEEYDTLKSKLESSGYLVTENSQIEENLKKQLEKSINKMLPTLIIFGIVVLTGIVSSSFIGAKTMLKKLSIFYCCGATKSNCIAISVGQTVMICLIAIIMAAGGLAVFVLTGLSNKVGFVFRANNLMLSAAVLTGAVLISAIAPAALITKTAPRELLTETAGE